MTRTSQLNSAIQETAAVPATTESLKNCAAKISSPRRPAVFNLRSSDPTRPLASPAIFLRGQVPQELLLPGRLLFRNRPDYGQLEHLSLEGFDQADDPADEEGEIG